MFINSRAMLLCAAALAAPASASAMQPEPNSNVAAQSPVGDTLELSLHEAIEMAQRRSFRAARSNRNQQISELRYKNAKSNYYPKASVGINADQSARGFRYDSDRFNSNQPTQGEFRGGLIADVSVPIDVSGNIKRQVGHADATREISAREVDQSVLEITLETQNNYLSALRAQDRVDADEGVVRELADLLGRSRLLASGTAPFLEVELANARQALSSSREISDRAQDGLKQSLRLPPDSRLRLTTTFTDHKEAYEREGLLDRALAGRPDVQQARLRIKQAEISARQVYDQRKPTLRVGGFYNDQYSARSAIGAVNGGADRFKNQGLGMNLSLPLAHFDNGQLSRQKRIALIQKEQAAADSEELQERVGYELRQALLSVQRAENRIRTLPNPKQAFDAMKRAEQQMLTAPEGQAQALLAQVSNARAAWRSAETASSEAYIDFNQSVFRLKRTLGERYDASGGLSAVGVKVARDDRPNSGE